MRAKISLNGTVCAEPLAVELYSIDSPDYELDRRYSQGGYVEFPISQTSVQKDCSHAPYLSEQGGDAFSVPSTRYPDVPLYEGYALNAKIAWSGKPLKC